MNRAPQNPDGIDQILTDFFQSQLPHPWPSAPVPAASLSQPSSLASRPAARSADSGQRARLTLAVSVAFLLGALWFLSPTGTAPRQAPKASPGGATDVLNGTATMPKEIDKHYKDRAKKSATGIDDLAPREPGARLDVVEPRRIEVVEGAELSAGIPPARRRGVEFRDLRGIEVRAVLHPESIPAVVKFAPSSGPEKTTKSA